MTPLYSRVILLALGIWLLTSYHRVLTPQKAKVKLAKAGPSAYDKLTDKDHWFLGACGTVRMNAGWVREWIELMRLSGVDHLFLINDAREGEDDGTAEVLEHYERVGYVSVIPGTVPKDLDGCRTADGNGSTHNCIAPKYCFAKSAPYVDWLLFVDSDEFVFPRAGCSAAEHIRQHCDPWVTHLRVRWERFGSSGYGPHPQGMLTENFLDSAAECETETEENNLNPFNNPFNMVGTCLHQKVIYNTRCTTVDHAGWIHWPTNHTAWVRGERPYYQQKKQGKWQSAAEAVPWKDERCRFVPFFDEVRRCSQWLEHGGGSREVVAFDDTACCSAGLGYNHYGIRSHEHWSQKMGMVGEAGVRGRKTNASRVDKSGFVSYGILKYVRALRAAHMAAGVPVSRRVEFHDDAESGRTCFIDRFYAYEPTPGLTDVAVVDIAAVEDEGGHTHCCALCAAKTRCAGFTLADGVCTLHFPRTTAGQRVFNDTLGRESLEMQFSGPRRRLIRTVIPGVRRFNLSVISGIVLSEEECYV
eukprot:TRINITY_DN771_c0_g7_i1.p1 TRINITY_DN771_c0_g7~~TRINITY_DN771_c0_g7_i1.p1  ORF type:complete len:529 (+),score=169.32 TRINITY_DN771_c0_g7_i1:51-1637(+)